MIKKVKYNVFDVFFGKGWGNWVRMESSNGKDWKCIAGDNKLAHGASTLLNRKLNKEERVGHG